jgi:hypothetical protein
MSPRRYPGFFLFGFLSLQADSCEESELLKVDSSHLAGKANIAWFL